MIISKISWTIEHPGADSQKGLYLPKKRGMELLSEKTTNISNTLYTYLCKNKKFIGHVL